MIELHNGDCLDVIKEIPDNSIDCVVTDPPFGLEHDLTTDTSIEKVLEILNALKTKSKNFAIIMDYRNFWRVDQLFQDSKIGELIWEYGWVSGFKARKKFGWNVTHNTIGLYGNIKDFCFVNGSVIRKQKGFYSPRHCSYAKKTGHPYEKPVKLMEYILKGCSKENDVILDPFMGSGSTGVACKNLNRNFIGIELNKEYFDIAKQRIENRLEFDEW